MKFDAVKRVWTCEFEVDVSIKAPTVVFVPEYQYPAGFSIFSPLGTTRAFKETQSIEYTPGHNAKTGDKHTITIFPKGEVGKQGSKHD